MTKRKPKAFLICPVRGVPEEESRGYMELLEVAGWDVHWPHRDTDQSDAVGDKICACNRAAIEAADVIFIVWDGKSKGCLFDLGIAWALQKPLRVLQAPPIKEGAKSFQAMMSAWAASGLWHGADEEVFETPEGK